MSGIARCAFGNFMFANLFKQFVYVQLSPQRLAVRDPVKQVSISEVPEIAIRKTPGEKARVAAVGSAARLAGSEPHTAVHNPFAHPRSLISDFTVAELLLKAFMLRLRGNAILVPAPVVVMHPLGEQAGGLTQIELRAMRELGLGAGASKVRLWEGPDLTDEQIMRGQFPSTGCLHE
ncbi:rod shape-determining protein [Piscinibacter gummiphilus]|uniref:rod shape-determining protein n=2 Tax=Piscinibacter gummiphilus TaxID=946333 RepID=UPI00235DBCAE|nr:rod shape-determining protein [Piscinibacter gummiphilus]GLS94424.1 rod shape-determining protein MreB [Piscinibacter gummiphilus]